MTNSWDTDEKAGPSVDVDEKADLCVNCHERPRFPPHRFCSRDCGRTCRLPDCSEKKREGSLYCSQPHRKAAVKLGISPGCANCGIFPQLTDSLFCGQTCAAKAGDGVFTPPPPSPKSGTAHIPRPPSLYIKPRSAYQISFGSYKGQANFLLRSKKGLAWSNLPSALDRLCMTLNFADVVLDFSLGTEGKYYLAYKDGHEVKMETSKNLWKDLNEDFHGGSVRQIHFGAEGSVWGLKSYREYKGKEREKEQGKEKISDSSATSSSAFDLSSLFALCGTRSRRISSSSDTDIQPPLPQNKLGLQEDEKTAPKVLKKSPSSSAIGGYTVHEEAFGAIPNGLVVKSAEIYPDLKHYGQVDFVAVGMGGAWVIGVLGKLCFWDKTAAGLVRKMTRVYAAGGSLRNVVLSPVSASIYLLEAKDGSVTYHVPDEWHAQIRTHFRPGNGLDMDPPNPTPRFSLATRPVRVNPAVIRRHPQPPPFTGVSRFNAPQNPFADGPTSIPTGPQIFAPPPYMSAQQGAPQYTLPPAPPTYHAVDPTVLYQNNAPSSGIIQGKGRKDQGEEMDVLVAMVEATPAVLNMGVNLVNLRNGAGGTCTIM